MRNLRILGTISIVVVSVVISLWAAEFWEQKGYQEWSEKDCNRMLTRSPWAFSESFRTTANLGSSTTGERETAEIIYFRLLTAKPVRMALARLQLLERPQDEALRKQLDDYVNSGDADRIVVQISYKSIPGATPYLQDLHTFFGHSTTATFHGQTVLVSSEKVIAPLLEFLPWTPTRPNAAFIFPRNDENGNPLFPPATKSLMLRSDFQVGQTIGSREYRINVKMEAKKMMFEGKWEF